MKKEGKPISSEKTRRADLTRTVWGNVLQIALGVLLLTCPDFGSATISLVVGWVLVGAGAIGIAVCVISWPVLELSPALLGAAGLGLGIYILINPLALAKLFGIFAGIYLLVQGVSTLLECRLLRKMGLHHLTGLILGLCMTALGVTLLFCPLTAARWVMILFGICLTVSGAVNLVIRAWAARKLSQPNSDPNIIDADE